MIVPFTHLKELRHTVAMVDGAFDPIHHGHIEYFRQARQQGWPLLCNIAPDTYLQTKHTPLLPAEQRAEVLDAIRYIDFTHVSYWDTEVVIRELRPAAFIKGKDWEGRLPAAQVDACRELGIPVLYLDTIRGSSSHLLHTFRDGGQVAPALEPGSARAGATEPR